MTDLERQAEEYAEHTFDMWRKDKAIGLKRMLAEAYEQGWVDRGRKSFNDEIAERSDFAPDCVFYDRGHCDCDGLGCLAKDCRMYTPENEKE